MGTQLDHSVKQEFDEVCADVVAIEHVQFMQENKHGNCHDDYLW